MKIALVLLALMLAACCGPSVLTQQNSPDQSKDNSSPNQAVEAAMKKVSNNRVKERLRLLLEQGSDIEKQQFISSGDQYEFPSRFSPPVQSSKTSDLELFCRQRTVCDPPQEICRRVGPEGQCIGLRLVKFCWKETIEPCEPVCKPGHEC